jgi:SsrA-binding protein
MTKPKKTTAPRSTIALNRKARFDYEIERTYEAGLVLLGWEIKSIRDGRANITDSYVTIKRGEAWLLNTQITPLLSASTHVNPDPVRTRKLLLHAKELKTLIGLREQAGYTLIPIKLYWKKNKVKIEIGVAKGKKKYDKRESEKNKDWAREKNRLLKKTNLSNH